VTERNSGISALSAISGIKESEVKEIWKEVQANKKLLDKCLKHDFHLISRDKYKCPNCSGTVDGKAKYWYNKGMSHSS